MRQLPPETMSIDETRTRLAALEAAASSLRHDLRGILAPALLVADRLLAHADPKVVRAGETVVKSVRRAEARLQETKAAPTGG
jgi:hypothetical protein